MLQKISRLQLSFARKALLLASLALPALAQTTGAPTPPFKQCPVIGSSNSCAILIVINPNGTVSAYTDPSVPPYDTAYDYTIGAEPDDTLVGVLNNSNSTITSLPLNGGSIPIFGFEGDGICDPEIGPTPAGCPFGQYGYEGPGVSFTNINGTFQAYPAGACGSVAWQCLTGSGSYNSGIVNFAGGLKPGQSTYFGLEEALTASQISIPLSTSCPTPTATAGASYSSQLVGTGGNGSYSWSLAAGSLDGLNLSTSGLVSGTASTSGTLNFTLQIADSSTADTPQKQACSIAVAAAPLSLKCTAPTATLTPGSSYSASCTATGGAPTYTFTYASFPTWLTATANGATVTLAGTVPNPPPTTYSPVVTVTDSTPSKPQTQSQTITINVGAPTLAVTCPATSNATAGMAFTMTCTASGGTPTYAWTYSNLPSWLTGGASGASVTISGTAPNPPPGSYTFMVTLTDTTAPTAQTKSQNVTVNVAPTALTVTCPATSSATAGTAFTATCSVTGGTPAYNWTYSNLPSWITAGKTGASVTLTGTPPSPPPASYSFGVTVTDSGTPVQTGTANMTVNVAIPQVQNVTISQVTGSSTATTAAVAVQFGAPATTNYTGTLTLTFKPAAGVTNVPSGYFDPAAGFAIGANSSALSQTFTIAQGQSAANTQFALGTVAGTWTATVTSLSGGVPTPAPAFSATVQPQITITPASVSIINKTTSSFTVQLTGTSTIRQVSSATFTFTAASGTQLQGNTSVTVPFNGLDQSEWFNTTAGLNAGGTFSLSVVFNYSGDPTAIGTVSVTLNNGAGQTSTAVTGN